MPTTLMYVAPCRFVPIGLRRRIRSRAFAMANFTAEAGKVYYFRERLFPGGDDYFFDLDLVNSDEGKYLVATSSFSVSHAKK